MKTIPPLLGLILIITCARAEAASETFTFNIPTAIVGTPGGTVDFTLGGFDPSLGTLNDVVLTFDATTSATPTLVTPFDAGTVSYSGAGLTFTTTLTGPGGAALAALATAVPVAGTITTTQFVAATLSTPTVQSASPSETITSGLSAFDGGTLSYSISAPTQSPIGTQTAGTAHAFFGGVGSYSGDVTEKFDYTAAPEPSTWMMLMAGIGVMGLRFRRLSQAGH